MAKWVFTDYWNDTDTWTFEVNPNDGGSPAVTKNLLIAQNTSPNRVNIVQEGASNAPTVSFSGVILTQSQYEALESWYSKRILIKVRDDLGRDMYGVFTSFSPKRVRRARNPWYHTYDAGLTLAKYTNASGEDIYGRV